MHEYAHHIVLLRACHFEQLPNITHDLETSFELAEQRNQTRQPTILNNRRNELNNSVHPGSPYLQKMMIKLWIRKMYKQR